MIYLRPAEIIDAPPLAELRSASLAEMGLVQADESPGFAAAARREMTRLFRERRIAAWVTCVGDAVVGSAFAVLYDRLPFPDGSLHAEIAGVYVMPAYRHRGFAGEMIREVVQAAHALGARRTFLRPAGARDLYERLGFVDDVQMTLARRGYGLSSVPAATTPGVETSMRACRES